MNHPKFNKNWIFFKNSLYPVDTVRKLNVNKMPRTSSERLMYVQFTSSVYGVCLWAADDYVC